MSKYRVDCIEEPTFPEPGRCVIMYRTRINTGLNGEMTRISGDKALHTTPNKALAYGWEWLGVEPDSEIEYASEQSGQDSYYDWDDLADGDDWPDIEGHAALYDGGY